MCIAIVLVIAMCLCLTSALPTYGGLCTYHICVDRDKNERDFLIWFTHFLALGLGQQHYPRGGYGGFGINPYAGSIGGIGSTDPVFTNGFGSEYGSRYGSYGGYSPYSPYYNNRYGGYGNQYGGIGGIGGGFQYWKDLNANEINPKMNNHFHRILI